MTIQKRPFGKTGHLSSSVIFGAAALWDVSQKVADTVLETLFEYGINHIDTAPRYGCSELRVGSWMRQYRGAFFLATKTAERTYKGAKESLHKSLERLNTDHIDLMQLHSLTHPDEWDQVFKSGGALEALVEAKKNGLVSHIGVTGHGWTAAAMHFRSLQKYNFDSILLPWNWFAANHRSYPDEFAATIKLCKQNDIAIQTIKSVARGPWAAGMTQKYNTWYQPLEDEDSIRKAVLFVLSTPGLFLNSAGDIEILRLTLRAAENLDYKPTVSEMREMNERTGLSSIFGL